MTSQAMAVVRVMLRKIKPENGYLLQTTVPAVGWPCPLFRVGLWPPPLRSSSNLGKVLTVKDRRCPMFIQPFFLPMRNFYLPQTWEQIRNMFMRLIPVRAFP